GALGAPMTGTPATPNLIDDHSWWIVPRSPQQVLSYVAAHRPAGSKPALSATGGNMYPAGTAAVGYRLRPVPNVLGTRWLVVTVTPLGHNQTGVRADAQVIWITPRPPSEKVPK